MQIIDTTPEVKEKNLMDLDYGQVFMFVDGDDTLYMIVSMVKSSLLHTKYAVPLNSDNKEIFPVITVNNFPVIPYTIEKMEIKKV